MSDDTDLEGWIDAFTQTGEALDDLERFADEQQISGRTMLHALAWSLGERCRTDPQLLRECIHLLLNASAESDHDDPPDPAHHRALLRLIK